VRHHQPAGSNETRPKVGSFTMAGHPTVPGNPVREFGPERSFRKQVLFGVAGALKDPATDRVPKALVVLGLWIAQVLPLFCRSSSFTLSAS
jgi:hypothetical protein